jgi:hypothetical protein
MTIETPPEADGSATRRFVLSDEETITLRRVAFGQSEMRMLRRADLERLTRLRLIELSKGTMRLTASGQEHFDSLPRPVLPDSSRQRDWQVLSPPAARPLQQQKPRPDRPVEMSSGARRKGR